MATLQELTPAITITAAEDYLLILCDKIFKARDLAKVESSVADASKIMFGLNALDTLEIDSEAYQQIIVGLNILCKVYQ
jgi:hypothetical protein